MLEFKEFSEPALIVHFRQDDEQAKVTAGFLVESGKSYDLGRNYSARFDLAHVRGQKDHLHVMLHQKDICVINKDGSMSHNTKIEDMPNTIKNKVKALGLVVIESTLVTHFLVEASVTEDVSAVLARHIIAVENMASA